MNNKKNLLNNNEEKQLIIDIYSGKMTYSYNSTILVDASNFSTQILIPANNYTSTENNKYVTTLYLDPSINSIKITVTDIASQLSGYVVLAGTEINSPLYSEGDTSIGISNTNYTILSESNSSTITLTSNKYVKLVFGCSDEPY